MSPVTLVKTRMEYGGPSHVTYRNTAHALATIARVEGPRALFRGMGPTVLTNAPFSALYFMLYTKLKHSLEAATAASSMGRGGGSMHSSSSGGGLHDSSSSSSGSWSSVAVNFVSGVVAATAATLLTQPSDVVRTRMQLGLPGAANGDALSTLGHVLRSSGGAHALLAGEAHACGESHRGVAWRTHQRRACEPYAHPRTHALATPHHRCCAARVEAHAADGAGVDAV
jgi:hypothetical protein